MEEGILIRGAITIGNLYHKSGVILGKGMIEAYHLELKSAVYPRIILSKTLIKELNYPLLAKEIDMVITNICKDTRMDVLGFTR